MPQQARIPQQAQPNFLHDTVALVLTLVLVATGALLVIVSDFDLVRILVYAGVAALIVLGAAYIREHPPEEPPDEHR